MKRPAALIVASFVLVALAFPTLVPLFSVGRRNFENGVQSSSPSATRSMASSSSSDSPKFVCISIILDQEFDDFDNLYSWLRSVNYFNFTFVIDSMIEEYVLNNVTRVNILKQYGKLIPRLAYYQSDTPAARKSLLDSEMANYSLKVGYIPSGVFDYVPDTYTANYLYAKYGVEYYQGYCFDQYAVDYLSERGGWQMPYYASLSHILVPNGTGRGIVVLPHSTWDWVSSFTSQAQAGQNLQLHPVNLINRIYNNNVTAAKNYFMSMISRTFADSFPFGFVNFQFEWNLTESRGDLDAVRNWTITLMSTYPNDLWTYEGLVKWFKSTYAKTPAYRINFTSPYDGQSIEWYCDTTRRVARMNENVVSYVNYSSQCPDKYLTQEAVFDWRHNSTDPCNCVDDSLIILIDALGGGFLRARGIASEAVPYPGDLANYSFSDEGLVQAVGFLEKLYNPSKGLCRETWIRETQNIIASDGTRYQGSTNETYWIASDNWLDSLALRQYDLTLSENISQTGSKYYNGSYFPYQTLQGKRIPLTLHVPNTYVLENSSGQVVVLNLYNGTVDDHTYLDYLTCGDALIYEAVNYYTQGYPFDWCKGLYMKAYNMFDGKGVTDSSYYNSSLNADSRVYANMKLALLIFGAKVLNANASLDGIVQQLWKAQKTSEVEVGGITSVTDTSGQPVGTANGETTAFTLLAYDNSLVEQIARLRQLVKPERLLNLTFPAATFSQTISITSNLTAIPLLSNWMVTFNNTVQWNSSQDNPRVALGFYSSLASKKNLSIQLIEYYDGSLDINLHNETYPDGYRIARINWSNPLTISLISDTLDVSSPAGTNITRVPSFPLAYITAGSTALIPNTNESGVCYGGEVNILEALPEFPLDLTLPSFAIATLLAIILCKRKRYCHKTS